MPQYFNRIAAKQAGLTDDEINKYLADQKKSGNSIIDDSQKASELTLSQQTANSPAPAETPKERSLLAKVLPILGSIGGGLAGAAVGGPVGAIAGASLGGGLGEGASELVSGENLNAGNIVKETALGGVGEVAGLGIGRGLGLIGKLGGKGAEATLDTTISGATRFSPSAYKQALESGVDLKGAFKEGVQKMGKEMSIGADPIEALVGKDLKGGKLKDFINEAENQIQATAGIGGNNIRISGEDVVKAIKSEAKNISTELGGANRKDAIKSIVSDAEEKYANGFTIKQGLKTLRAANEKFGNHIFTESGDAVVGAAQKLEADVVRTSLKSRFPSIAGALDDQQKWILLREGLKNTYSKAAVSGSTLGKVNIARPGTVIDQFLNNPRVAGVAAKMSGATAPTLPSAGGLTVGSLLQSGAGQVGARAINDTGSPNQSSGGGIAGPQAYTPMGGIAPQQQQEKPQTATLPNGQTVSITDFQQAALKDLQTNGGRNLDKIKKAQELVFGKARAGLELSDTAIKTINDLHGGITDLQKLYTQIEGKNLTGPLRGLFSNIPGNVEQQTLQSEIDRVRQTIGKALEGGVLRKEDEEKYKKILPTINDPKEVALRKMKQLYQKLNEDLSGYVNLQKGYGTATSGGTPVTSTDSSQY